MTSNVRMRWILLILFTIKKYEKIPYRLCIAFYPWTDHYCYTSTVTANVEVCFFLCKSNENSVSNAHTRVLVLLLHVRPRGRSLAP